MDKRKDYINKLLTVINSLHTSVSAAQKDDAISFSFFKDSFNKSQEIMSLIHDLEMLHIEDMKHQMERLIVFLSENEDNRQEKKETIKEEVYIPPPPVERKVVKPLVLPIYTNPNAHSIKEQVREEIKEDKPIEQQPISDIIANNIAAPSINDVVKAPQSKIDVRRGFSLNDRFFFQRELFDNNRETMNSMMEHLDTLNTYEDIEEYLKENTSWSFDDKNVKSFLEIISKGIN